MKFKENIEQFINSIQEERENFSQNIDEYPYRKVLLNRMFLDLIQSEKLGSCDEIEELSFSKIQKNRRSYKIDGYSLDVEAEDNNGIIYLYVSYFRDVAKKWENYTGSEDNFQNEITISVKELGNSIKYCKNFFDDSKNGKLLNILEPAQDEYALAKVINFESKKINQVHIVVMTDLLLRDSFRFSNQFSKDKQLSISMKIISLDTFFNFKYDQVTKSDINLEIEQTADILLPCIYLPKLNEDSYSCCLTAIPGDILYDAYATYNDRLLDSNVRSFLSLRKKANKKIKETIINDPEDFLAYNNGLVIVANEVIVKQKSPAEKGISSIKGVQIVNGGQTTASLYFTKLADHDIDLRKIRIQAKIIIVEDTIDVEKKEEIISNISEYSNTQSVVKASDFLFHNKFFISFDKRSRVTKCVDNIGWWFFERAQGSYKTYIALHCKTPTQRKRYTKEIIPRKRVIKKTELLQSIAASNGYPLLAAFGEKKVAVDLMTFEKENIISDDVDQASYKLIVSQFIVYKRTYDLFLAENRKYKNIKKVFAQGPGIVRIAVVNLLTKQFELDYKQIWANPDLSLEFQKQLVLWGLFIQEKLIEYSNNGQFTEYGKKQDCWDKMGKLILPFPEEKILEIVKEKER